MAGIYLHIPFCRQACHYCDFHFSTSLKDKEDLLQALKKEIALQQDYLGGKNINTIYFGGGTPSLLSKEELLGIFSEISKYFSVDANAEITLEANPDDLTKEKLKELSQTPVNRLSIGIQSFSNEDLKLLNRAHDSVQAMASVKEARSAGFKNITIDLIYGIQTLSNDQWKKNLSIAFELEPEHVSSYSLTVEPKTAMASFITKGAMAPVDSGKTAEQFQILMEEMSKKGFVHYEISNFCKEGYYSRHNSNYWKGEKYLGIGPSAHSYNGDSRQWNVKSNSGYISALKKGQLPFEKEVLSENQRYNEYILTSLRTVWGTDLKKIENDFSKETASFFMKNILDPLKNSLIEKRETHYFLTNKGKLFADKVASDLFIV